MLYGFLIACVLSLPVAIPAFIVALIIHFVNKKQREKNNYMYNPLPPQQMMNVTMDPQFAGEGGNTAGFAQEAAQPAMQGQNTFMSAPPKPVKQKPQREPMSSSAVMLLIGTALVVLSGIAFGAANWLSTSPMGRVLIICIASVVSFIISFGFMKLVKLKGTSSAFYMVGTMLIPVAILIAGFYDMLGRWLSFDGGGRYLMFAFSFFIISAGCFIGHKLYKSKHFVYSGLAMMSAGLTFIALQTALIDNVTSLDIFASVLIVFQAVITALIYVFGLHKRSEFAEAIKLIGTITSIVYVFISMSHVFGSFVHPLFGTFFILGIAIIQLIFYGIYLKQEWMLSVQSVLSVILAVLTARQIYTEMKTEPATATLIFIALAALIFVVNRFVPKLRDPFSVGTALTAMSFGCVAALNYLAEGPTALILMVSVITSAIIYAYLLDKREPVQIAAGIVSPMLPIVTAVYIRDMLVDLAKLEAAESDHLVYGILAVIFTAISAALLFMPKFAFDLHAAHPRKTETGIYVNMGAVLLMLVTVVKPSSLIFIPLAALIIHFITANFMKNNIMAVGSGVISCAYLEVLLQKTLNVSGSAFVSVIFSCFLMLMAVSKIVYGSAVITKKEGRIVFDTALLSGWILIPFMDGMCHGSNFFVMLSLAIYTACFVKKNTKEDAASVLLSISAVIAAMALFNRPFLLPENEMVYNKITLAIIAMVGIAFRIIWRKHERGAKISSNIIFIGSFAALMIDALYFEDPGNTVFVLAVTTAILIVSFMVKSKTWFSASSIAIVTIVLYAAKDFLASLSGWVYLFAAGIILIGIAAMNEYYKQKGENVKSKLAGVFSDWQW